MSHNALADELERRRLKFADVNAGHYEMLSEDEHAAIVSALREPGYAQPIASDAEARLMAAAPDLLDACKRASEILRGRGYPGWGIAKDILNEAISRAELGSGRTLADANSKSPIQAREE